MVHGKRIDLLRVARVAQQVLCAVCTVAEGNGCLLCSEILELKLLPGAVLYGQHGVALMVEYNPFVLYLSGIQPTRPTKNQATNQLPVQDVYVVWLTSPTLVLQALKGMLNSNTKLVATVHVSNMLASITDVAELSVAAHAVRSPRSTLYPTCGPRVLIVMPHHYRRDNFRTFHVSRGSIA